MDRHPGALLPTPLPWHKALGRRVATLWLLKMIGNSAGIACFFPLYFWVMQRSPAEVWVLPLTALDRWFELRAAALPLYGSLWLYISLPPAFAKDKRELFAYAWGCGLMSAVGLAVFWFMPTAVPAFPIDWSQHPALQFLKATDSTGNAFPSLHVAFAVFACDVLARQLREIGAPAWLRAANVAWAVGIVYSTLAIRQHVVVDVFGGLLLGLAFCWAFRRGMGAVVQPVRASAGAA